LDDNPRDYRPSLVVDFDLPSYVTVIVGFLASTAVKKTVTLEDWASTGPPAKKLETNANQKNRANIDTIALRIFNRLG